MKNKFRRFIAFLLGMILIISALPATFMYAYAEELIIEDFEGDTHSFRLVNASKSSYEYWETDTSQNNANVSEHIYGVGSSGGDVGAYMSIDEISSNIEIKADVRLDGVGSGKVGLFSLLGAHCANDYLNTSANILTISGVANGNGYWGSINLNGIDITKAAKISNPSESGNKGGLRRDSTGWLNMDAVLNFDAQTAYVKLTRISNDATVYEGLVPFKDNVGHLSEIYIAASSGYGGVFVDNIEISEPTDTEYLEIIGADYVNQGETHNYKYFEKVHSENLTWSVSGNDSVSINQDGELIVEDNAQAGNAVIALNGDNGRYAEKTITIINSDAVPYITAKADGNSTAVDTSSLFQNGSVTGFLVTTAKNGKQVNRYITDCAQSVIVDTTNAEDIEISSVYTYTDVSGAPDSVTLSDKFQDGRYDITFKKSAAKCCDIYVNGYMAANNVDQPGYGRSRSSGAEYTAKDVRIEGGSITIQTTDILESDGELSWVRVEKCPDIVDRKKRITIIGDSLVCNYYGSGSGVLGTRQTGWGQALSDFITEEYEVINLANSGYYAKNMYTTSFPSVIYNSEQGDILLFEAGYNDYTYSNETEMTEYVNKMIDEAQTAGITVIPISPNACVETYSYPVRFGNVMKQCAEEKKAGFIDLAYASYRYLNDTYGDDTDAIKASIGLLSADNTHSSYIGAYKYASFVANRLYKMGYTDMINTEYEYSATDSAGNEIVCSDLIDTPAPDDTNPTDQTVMKFVFGTNSKEGYTSVVNTEYSEYTGFGFEDSENITVGENNVTSSGDYKFKLTVENGNYNVNIVTSAKTVKSETIDTVPSITGITKDTSEPFDTAVCDNVLDITVPSGETLSELIITKKSISEKRENPALFAVGDSTASNTADGAKSWGNCVEEGDVKLPDNISRFYNCGYAGTDSVNFYNEGRMEYVLLNMCEGDYVTINMGINSRAANESSSFTAMIRDYYVEAVKQRGGIPIILTYTAYGPVKVEINGVSYDYESKCYNDGAFSCARTDYNREKTLRAIAAVENIDVIELGSWMNSYFNGISQYTAESNGFESPLAMVQSWYVDFNHYKQPLGEIVGEYIVNEISKRALSNNTSDILEWDFSEYTTEYNGSSGTQTEYNGLTINLVDNSSDKDHDRITTSGVYWRGSAASGDAVRYIEYTPTEDGKLYAVGKLTLANSRWGISDSISVTSLKAECSTQNMNETTVSMNCTAGTTYYILAKGGSPTTISYIKYVPESVIQTASVELNNIYSDNMLIQRGKPFIFDGTSENAISAVLTLVNDNNASDRQERQIEGLSDGAKWSAEFDAISNYADTYTLTIEPIAESEQDIAEKTVISNIQFGDLYLCGGQSNMWWYLKKYYDANIDYDHDELDNCANSKIRILQLPTPDENKYVGNQSSEQSSLTIDGQWRELNPDFIQKYYLPATVYSLATDLYNETEVPIGILSTAVGGTYISQWRKNTGSDSYNSKKNWYNTRIYPFRNTELSGIFWYQGCNDRNNGADYYEKAMTGLIREYRELFGSEDLPFYYVQLARNGIVYPDTTDIESDDNTGMRDVRRAQTDVYLNADNKANLGFVSTLDLYGVKEYTEGKNSNYNARVNYHTGQKPVIAKRLADLALSGIYGKTERKDGSTVYTHGPLYKSHYTQGNKLVVEFDCNGSLAVMNPEQYADNHSLEIWEEQNIDTSKIQEFEIAGEDGVYYAANAELDGNRVILTADEVENPISVRYAYAAYPECPNLTDDSQLPAYAFTAEIPVRPHWDFQFGSTKVNEDSIAVDSSCEYSEEQGYGFLGISKNSIDYTKVVDGWYQTEDTLTHLSDGDGYVYTKDKNRPIRFAVKVQPNTYYKVKVTMGGADFNSDITLTSERRHFILTQEKINAGDTVSKEFTVAVHNVKWKNRDVGEAPVAEEYTDDMLNICVTGENALINSIEIEQIEKPKTVWIFGDSTVCDTYSKVPYNGFDTSAGWGNAVAKYIPENAAVVNLAEGGLNTGDTSYFDIGKNDISEGDIVIMQMGHNEKSVSTYKSRLDTYYNAVNSAGAEFVLCSPIEQLKEGQAELPWEHTKQLTDYAAAAKEYAEEKEIPYVDLNTLTYDFNNKIGIIPSWYLHTAYWSGTAQNYTAVNDATHMNDYGADNSCRMLMESISVLADTYPELEPYVKEGLDAAIMPSEEIMKNGTEGYVMPPYENDAYFPYPDITDDFEYETELSGAVVEGDYLKQVTLGRNVSLSYITVFAASYKSDGTLYDLKTKHLEPSAAGTSEVVDFTDEGGMDGLKLTDSGTAKVFVWNGAFRDGSMDMRPLSEIYEINR